MHLDDERLQRLMDGELAAADEAAARTHVADCAECRSRLESAEREERRVQRALRAGDLVAPALDLDAVVRRASMEEAPRRRSAARWALAVAAALALAGAVFAMPGSPLHRWMTETLRAHPRVGTTPAAPPSAPSGPNAGVAIAPGERLVIDFVSPPSEGGARIAWSDGSEVEVRAPTGAASFTTEAGRLVIDNRGAARVFEIRLPRNAPRVEVRVAGVRVLLAERGRATPAVADSAVLLPLEPGAP